MNWFTSSRLRPLGSGLLWMAILLVPLGAQNQTPTQTAATITVTGCLQHAERNGSLGGTVLGTTATPNTAPVDANLNLPVGFVLANARPSSPSTTSDPNAGAAPTGTAGVRGPAATSSDDVDLNSERPTTYGLEGDQNALAAELGHRVEVSGTPMDRPQKDGAFQTGTKILKVQTVKKLADSCSP